MYAVERIGSYISRGVYTVSGPFHPFGGAVDIIVVEQPDGSFKSSPWYVRFGKFQGVLKSKEKVVSISANGVEADFHMFLDKNGEAFFLREVNDVEGHPLSFASSSGKEADGNFSQRMVLKSRSSDYEYENENLVTEISLSNGELLAKTNSRRSRIFGLVFGRKPIKNDGDVVRTELLDRAEIAADLLDVKWATNLASGNQKKNVASSSPPLPVFDRNADNVLQTDDGKSEVDPLVNDDNENSSGLPVPHEEHMPQNLDMVDGSTYLLDGVFKEDNGVIRTFSSVYRGDSESSMIELDSDGEQADGTLDEINETKIIISEVNSPPEACIHVKQEPSNAQEGSRDKNCFIFPNDAAVFESEEISSYSFIGTAVSETYSQILTIQRANSSIEEVESQGVVSIVLDEKVIEQEGDLGKLELTSQIIGDIHNDIRLSPDCRRSLPSEDSEEEQLLFGEPDDCKHVSDACTTSNFPDHAADKAYSSFIMGDTEASCEGFCIKDQTNSSPDKFIQRDSQSDSSPDKFIQKDSQCDGGFRTRPKLSSSGIDIPTFGIVEKEGGQTAQSLPCMWTHDEDTHDPLRHSLGRSFDSTSDSYWMIKKYVNGVKSDIFPEKASPRKETTEDTNVSDDLNTEPTNDAGEPFKPNDASGGSWRLWPFPFKKTQSVKDIQSDLDHKRTSGAESSLESHNILEEEKDGSKPKVSVKLARVLTPTSKQLASLNLNEGRNTVTFTFSTQMLGKQEVHACIYLWRWDARIVISDVDGTITKSDVLGQFMPLVGMDWSQTGVTSFFSAIKENGYQFLYLSARSISQAYHTRQFLFNLKQDGKALPDGPVVISPDGLFPSLFREVIRRAPHEFKIACLEEIKALFPSDRNPYYAGFGNRDTDEISYLKVGIPKGKIFIINPKGQVAVQRRVDTKSYTSLHDLVHGMFPPISSYEQEDFNTWNYWRLPIPGINL